MPRGIDHEKRDGTRTVTLCYGDFLGMKNSSEKE